MVELLTKILSPIVGIGILAMMIIGPTLLTYFLNSSLISNTDKGFDVLFYIDIIGLVIDFVIIVWVTLIDLNT